MEKYITIPTLDGFEINGVLNWKEKSEKLIIFCHGLTGYGGEAQYVCGKDFFLEKGYEVLRFDFYDGGENNRKLRSCSIDDHARDIETILEKFSEDYSEIILVGHSLGGPSIVRMKKNLEKISKIVFWDPAFDNREYMKGFMQYGDIFLFDGDDGRHIQVSEDIVKQRAENHLEMLKDFSFPRENMSIIFAGGNNKIDFKAQTDALGIQGSVIEGANHGFTQEGKFEELFEKTLECIEK